MRDMRNRRDYWLFEGIVVKVMSKSLAEKGYYKKKRIVVCEMREENSAFLY